MASNRVLVVGAFGYIGRNLISRLLAAGGIEVLALVRSPANEVCLPGIPHEVGVVRSSLEDSARILRQAGRIDVLINLAYGSRGLPFERYRSTLRIARQVVKLAREARVSKLIHVSTCAVFGYSLDTKPEPRAVKRRSGDDYIIGKWKSETIIARADLPRVGITPVIVRPGNTVGPAAPAWTVRLLDMLLHAHPVAYRLGDGFSNATYVENLCDYLCHLVRAPAAALDRFGPYNHVAEFSHVPWSVWVNDLAAVVGGAGAVVVDPPVRRESQGYFDDLYKIIRSLSLADVGQVLFKSAFVGGTAVRVLSSLVGTRIGTWLAESMRAARDSSKPVLFDPRVLDILSLRMEFKPHVLSSWVPPVNLESARERIVNWARSAGYARESAGACDSSDSSQSLNRSRSHAALRPSIQDDR